MAVFLADLTISVVDHKLSLLVAANLSSAIDSLLLGVGVLDGPFATADFDVPAA